MSTAERAAFLPVYVAAQPALLARFANRISERPELAGTDDDALTRLGPWFADNIERLAHAPDDPATGWPVWWDEPAVQRVGPDHPGFGGVIPSRAQLQLTDEVGAHLTQVVQQRIPACEWATKDGGPDVIGSGQPGLRGPFGFNSPCFATYGMGLNAINGRRERITMLAYVHRLEELAGLR